MLQPFTLRAVPNLIVILIKVHKVVSGKTICWPTVSPLTVAGVLATIDKRMLQRFVQVAEGTKIIVITFLSFLRPIEQSE